MTTWLIIGASSGLGDALARAVLDRGHNAVVTARNVAHLDDLVNTYPDTALAVPLEVADHDQVVDAVTAAVDHRRAGEQRRPTATGQPSKEPQGTRSTNCSPPTSSDPST